MLRNQLATLRVFEYCLFTATSFRILPIHSHEFSDSALLMTYCNFSTVEIESSVLFRKKLVSSCSTNWFHNRSCNVLQVRWTTYSMKTARY